MLRQLDKKAADPAVYQNPMAINRVYQQEKELRASIGEQSFADRISDAVHTGVNNRAAGLVSAVGTIGSAVQDPDRLRQQIGAERRTLVTGRAGDGSLLTPEMRSAIRKDLARMEEKVKQWESPDSFSNKAKAEAGRLRDRGTEAYRRASSGLGTAGKTAVDLGVAGTQLGMGALTSAILSPGITKAIQGIAAFGNAAQDARDAGADLNDQLLAGGGAAGITVATNQLSNLAGPFRRIYGSGAAENIAGRLAERFGSNAAVQMMTNLSDSTGGRILLSGLGEGVEEPLEGALQAAWKRYVYDPDATYTKEEAVHDAFLAGFLGAAGGVAEGIGQTWWNLGQTETGTAGLETLEDYYRKYVGEPSGGSGSAPLDALRPLENMTYAEWEPGVGTTAKKQLTNTLEEDNITPYDADIEVGRSLGAAAFRDNVKLPDGRTAKLTEGSKITKVFTFAGKGAKKPLRVAGVLAKQYRAGAEGWSHRRGDGYVDVDGGSKHVELHWFEHKDVGRVKMKVKRYFRDES